MGDAAPFDAVAARYDDLYDDPSCEAEDWWLDRRLAPMVLRSGARVLDVGCGTGWFLRHHGERVPRYLGLDISGRMIEEAVRRHGRAGWQFAQHDMQRAPWPVPQGIHTLAVSLWCSASYLPPMRMFAEVLGALRPGGEFLLMPHALGADTPVGVRGDHYLPDACYNGSTGWAPWRAGEVAAQLAAMEREGYVSDARVETFRSALDVPARAPRWAHRAARLLESRALDREGRRSFLVVTGRKGA